MSGTLVGWNTARTRIPSPVHPPDAGPPMPPARRPPPVDWSPG